MSKLGRLARVGRIRDVWPDEARDFTPWLARPENLAVLSDALGLGEDGLEYEAEEASVGPFRADIVCRDITSPERRVVLIENQFGRSDHDHLGKLFTYASGLKANTVVLVGEEIREEHRQALTWMNSITDEDHRFFGREVELWRIGDSEPAPRFNVVVEPNEWARQVAVAAGSSGAAASELKQGYVRYWEAFVDTLGAKTNSLHPGKPKPKQWMTFRSGRSGIYFAVGATQRDRYIRVSLVIQTENAKELFEELLRSKDEISACVGVPLEWDSLPHAQRSIVHLTLKNVAPMDQTDWVRQHNWLSEYLIKFSACFRPLIQRLGTNTREGA